MLKIVNGRRKVIIPGNGEDALIDVEQLLSESGRNALTNGEMDFLSLMESITAYLVSVPPPLREKEIRKVIISDKAIQLPLPFNWLKSIRP